MFWGSVGLSVAYIPVLYAGCGQSQLLAIGAALGDAVYLAVGHGHIPGRSPITDYRLAVTNRHSGLTDKPRPMGVTVVPPSSGSKIGKKDIVDIHQYLQAEQAECLGA
ncbi:MAG: hypothetical protein J07HX5_00708 [halophilic archaeon J07HX5]|nr:MAG: hypothetical protein J07HX5_00708 [halophilic archaeon J07HX5]